VLAEITAAAADHEQSSRTHLMPRQQRQLGYAAAQNSGICSQVPCRGSPSGNRGYSAVGCWVPGGNQAGCGELEWRGLRGQLSACGAAAPVALVVTGLLGGVLRGYG
jgi:hypothetical protein